MSPQPRGAPVRQRGEVVLFFGEDPYDGRAIAELFRALCPGFRGRCKAIRSPFMMARNTRLERAAQMADLLCRQILQNQIIDDVRCVFVVQDCDATEPEDEQRKHEIESALQRANCEAHVVVIAWEIEAWWFLWPDVATRVVRSWRTPDGYVGRQVGLVVNAKEAYRRAVRPIRGRPDYEEAHSPLIAEQVRISGNIRAPQARSESFHRFIAQADACCSVG